MISAKIINHTTKNNLTNQISPFFSEAEDEYKITYCLFSQFTAYELLDIYTSWMWRLADRDIVVKKDMVVLIGTLVKGVFSMLAIMDKWDLKHTSSLAANIEMLYGGEIESAILIDRFVIEYLPEEARFDNYMKCAALTRQMMFNAYLASEKKSIPAYEI